MENNTVILVIIVPDHDRSLMMRKYDDAPAAFPRYPFDCFFKGIEESFLLTSGIVAYGYMPSVLRVFAHALSSLRDLIQCLPKRKDSGFFFVR